VSDSEGSPKSSSQLPVLPLRDVVVYPHMVIPLFVGREKSIDALDAAMSVDKRIMLAAQTSAAVNAQTSPKSQPPKKVILLLTTAFQS